MLFELAHPAPFSQYSLPVQKECVQYVCLCVRECNPMCFCVWVFLCVSVCVCDSQSVTRASCFLWQNQEEQSFSKPVRLGDCPSTVSRYCSQVVSSYIVPRDRSHSHNDSDSDVTYCPRMSSQLPRTSQKQRCLNKVLMSDHFSDHLCQ